MDPLFAYLSLNCLIHVIRPLFCFNAFKLLLLFFILLFYMFCLLFMCSGICTLSSYVQYCSCFLCISVRTTSTGWNPIAVNKYCSLSKRKCLLNTRTYYIHIKDQFSFLRLLQLQMVTAVAQRLRCCGTNRKVAGSIPDGVTVTFHWHNPSDRTMALGSTQPLTEMSTRSISWG